MCHGTVAVLVLSALRRCAAPHKKLAREEEEEAEQGVKRKPAARGKRPTTTMTTRLPRSRSSAKAGLSLLLVVWVQRRGSM